MTGNTSIITFTIASPNLGDLITFYNPVYKAKEIFRVINIVTATGMVRNDLPYYELELEYAPLTDINIITLYNHYVYDLSLEKYLIKSDYVELIKTMENIKKILVEINKYYHSKRDLYSANDLVSIEVNELISYLKKDYNNNYYRLFEEVKNPFNYYSMYKRKYFKFEDFPYYNKSNNEFYVHDLSKKNINKVIWEQDDAPKNEIQHLISLGRDLYNELNNSIFEKVREF